MQVAMHAGLLSGLLSGLRHVQAVQPGIELVSGFLHPAAEGGKAPEHAGLGAELLDVLHAAAQGLPPCVQKGTMVLPLKRCFSSRVNRAMGMVPHQLG